MGLPLADIGPEGRQQHAVVQGLCQVEVVLPRLFIVLRGQISQHSTQVDGIRPMGDPVFPGPQQVCPAYQLVHCPDSQSGHDLPKLPGNEEHEVHHVFRLALEPAPKLRILGGNAHGASVQVAYPQHDAAHGNQRGGGEAEFLGT